MNQPTACALIIGDEILSGRTKEANLAYIAESLNVHGIRLARAHILPDDESEIIATLQQVRAQYDYIFTTGGIGPTHDDITAACIAKACNAPLERNVDAQARLEAHYTDTTLNEARLKMADIPRGAALIDNPISAASGFIVDNIYVMAGVPRICQAMCDAVIPTLQGGDRMLSLTVTAYAREGDVAAELGALQVGHKHVSIGCYPLMRNGKMGCSLVARSTQQAALDALQPKLVELMQRNSNGDVNIT